MHASPYEKRVAALRAKLTSLAPVPYDVAWILQPENRRYLSGFEAEDAQLTESSGSLFITRDMRLLVTDSRYTLEAEKEAAGFQVVTVKNGLVEEFPSILAITGTGTMGFERDHLTWGLHGDLSQKIKESALPLVMAPLNNMVEHMREVKDPEEVDALEASALAMSAILDELIPGLKPGLVERDVAWRIENLAREAGADRTAFPPIVASGPNGALPHAVPGRKRLERGEPVVLDVGIRLRGYCSDMTRTVFLGDPSREFKKIYKTVREAQLAAMAEIRPGVQSTHPDAVARRIIAESGYGDCFGHSLGHGVGLATHEQPRMGPRKPVELKKGMVVTVEPGIYIPGKGGVRLEEMVVVEDGGARRLTANNHFYDF